MSGLENSERYLVQLRRHDLANLISNVDATVRSEVGFWEDIEDTIELSALSPVSDALEALSELDKKRIVEALSANELREKLKSKHLPNTFETRHKDGPQLVGQSVILPLLMMNKETLINVATGKQQIQEVNDHYRGRHFLLVDTAVSVNFEYECRYDNLWDWYSVWKESFPTYADRRKHIREMFDPMIERACVQKKQFSPHREPTGWERVDRALSKARNSMEGALHPEDYQSVGLLCREVLISVAQEVFKPETHQSLDGVLPSSTDAKRMLEAFLHSVFPGDSYKEVRSHARASIDLSLNLQHRRTATKQLAALCFEATTSCTAVMKILTGHTS